MRSSIAQLSQYTVVEISCMVSRDYNNLYNHVIFFVDSVKVTSSPILIDIIKQPSL